MNEWKNKNVFVTGGTGFIGTNLVQSLIDDGANVTVLVRDHKPKSYFYTLGLDKEVNMVNGDLTNGRLLIRILNEYEIDTVFHLAAQSIVTAGNKSPLSTFETNIKGTWELLEACRVCDTKRVVVASSDKAYGTHDELPYSEHMALKGEHPYDVSKSCMDLLAQCYYKTYGLRVAITRCANIYGPGDYNFSRLIPKLIRASFTNEEVEIRGGGQMERDFMYINDAVNAYKTLAMNLDRDDVAGQAFNFGWSEPIKIINVAREFEKIVGTKLNFKIEQNVSNEISKQYLDSQKAKEILGWEPLVNLINGLKRSHELYNACKNDFLKEQNEG